jgi:predicted ATPase
MFDEKSKKALEKNSPMVFLRTQCTQNHATVSLLENLHEIDTGSCGIARYVFDK